MNAQSQHQPEELDSLLEELRKQLLEACTHFDIWLELWPTEDKVGILNAYKGFFLPTRKAHLDQWVIKVSNIVSNDAKAPSFYRVLRMLDRNASLAPGVDVGALRTRLKSQEKVLKAIEQYRNKRAAHWDTTVAQPLDPVLVGDSRRLLEELEKIFNEVHYAHTRSQRWAFKLVQHGDTSLLLDNLRVAKRQTGTIA